jgi:hypothetical protein
MEKRTGRLSNQYAFIVVVEVMRVEGIGGAVFGVLLWPE